MGSGRRRSPPADGSAPGLSLSLRGRRRQVQQVADPQRQRQVEDDRRVREVEAEQLLDPPDAESTTEYFEANRGA